MPVTVHKRRDKYRVVEITTNRIAKSRLGRSSDGGGHKTRAKALRQMRAINAAHTRKKQSRRVK